jgi:hypothetical protein
MQKNTMLWRFTPRTDAICRERLYSSVHGRQPRCMAIAAVCLVPLMKSNPKVLSCWAWCCADYLNFLAQVTPDNQEEYLTHMRRFNLGPVGEADCPVFDGMFEYFQVGSGNMMLVKHHCACVCE